MVSNYLDHPNGTTRHLHVDVQVFTRDGWLRVNPYVAHAVPAPGDAMRSDIQEGSDN